MDLDKFYGCLRRLYEEIGKKVECLENDAGKGFSEMDGLLKNLAGLLPDWFFFIEQTGIGTKDQILSVLQDMEAAVIAEDTVLLADTLLYGLQKMAGDYMRIIEEAVYEG